MEIRNVVFGVCFEPSRLEIVDREDAFGRRNFLERFQLCSRAIASTAGNSRDQQKSECRQEVARQFQLGSLWDDGELDLGIITRQLERGCQKYVMELEPRPTVARNMPSLMEEHI